MTDRCFPECGNETMVVRVYGDGSGSVCCESSGCKYGDSFTPGDDDV